MRRYQSKANTHRIESSSGDPQTHPVLDGEGVVSERRVPLVQEDDFVCRDAVDVVKLLRAVRATLYENAETLGGSVLVDEQWTCSISVPRHRNDRTYKVHIQYTASAARSDRNDPQRPVAMERARGVPGLMTIVSRHD
ncbi:hypothetical protein BKA93DRAFT_729404 [Sparassis latifolia]